MDIYDSNGNLIGEILDDTKEIVANTGDRISGWFESSIILGLLGSLVHPILGIATAIIMVILRLLVFTAKWVIILIWWIIKFLARCLWWLIRFPFTLAFYHETPIF